MQELMQEQGISACGMEMTCLGRQSREVARGEPCRHLRRDDGLCGGHISWRGYPQGDILGAADKMCSAGKDGPASLKGDFPSFRHGKEAKRSPTGYDGTPPKIF